MSEFIIKKIILSILSCSLCLFSINSYAAHKDEVRLLDRGEEPRRVVELDVKKGDVTEKHFRKESGFRFYTNNKGLTYESKLVLDHASYHEVESVNNDYAKVLRKDISINIIDSGEEDIDNIRKKYESNMHYELGCPYEIAKDLTMDGVIEAKGEHYFERLANIVQRKSIYGKLPKEAIGKKSVWGYTYPIVLGSGINFEVKAVCAVEEIVAEKAVVYCVENTDEKKPMALSKHRHLGTNLPVDSKVFLERKFRFTLEKGKLPIFDLDYITLSLDISFGEIDGKPYEEIFRSYFNTEKN